MKEQLAMNLVHSLKIVDAAIEEFNERDWVRFGEYHAESVVLQAPTLPEPVTGRPAVQEWARTLATAFPDLVWTPTQIFGQDNRVVAEITATGTHTGPLHRANGQVVPATGKSIDLKIAAVFTVEGDEVSEVHIYNNLLALLVQLGLMPA